MVCGNAKSLQKSGWETASSLQLDESVVHMHNKREARMRAFVNEALAAGMEIDRRGRVYRAEDVHRWIERIAKGQRLAAPPAP
jgi:predicted transcriptional regulator